MNDILTTALAYEKAGFSVIPIRHGQKAPAYSWTQYQAERPTPEMIRTWFSGDKFTALGLITGEVSGGLLILDFDGDGWEKARDEFLGAFPEFVDTRHVQTGSGKLHIWFAADDISNGDKKPLTRMVFKRPDLGKDTAIELRGNNMQALAPPSLHPSGNYYKFLNKNEVARSADVHEILGWLESWQKNEKGKETNKATPTDDDLAARWITQNQGTAYGLSEWRRYEAGYWPIVSEDTVSGEALQVCIMAKSEGVRPGKARVNSVAEMARLLIYVNDARWNTAENAIALQNGTFDLNKMTLREHRPGDYMTRALDYAYDPGATCAYFDYALYSTIPDAADFLQEFAGYCLTTETNHETAAWFYGPPGSGKSTLIHGITTMLGDLSGFLSLAQIERSQFALADLPGKRMVMSTEQPSMYIKSAWVLNAIISGEPVVIEQKNQRAYTVKSQAKVVFAMNDLPHISDASNGIFRRVKVVKFPPILPQDRNEELKNLIAEEGPGIFNWALVGLRRLRERGRFEIPECVMAATDDFKRNNDKASLFVEECGLVGPDNRIQSQELYNAYRTWCLDNGHKVESSTTMAGEWTRLGFEKKRIVGKSWWQGVGLLVHV